MKPKARVRFEIRVELVNTYAPYLWKNFENGVVNASDEVREKKSKRDRKDV